MPMGRVCGKEYRTDIAEIKKPRGNPGLSFIQTLTAYPLSQLLLSQQGGTGLGQGLGHCFVQVFSVFALLPLFLFLSPLLARATEPLSKSTAVANTNTFFILSVLNESKLILKEEDDMAQQPFGGFQVVEQ
jgi:hypothetical protein